MSGRMEEGVELTRLANGARVVTHEMPHLKSATVGVWFATGSRNETPETHGISHLLEHMAFKATTSRSARQMAEEIEAVGGEINAATSQESTAYVARVLEADTGLALELLADMLNNPKFDEEELERERGVILQEIASVADQPEELVFEAAEEAAFTGQALGRPILGTKATVSSFSPAALRTHLARHYTARQMVICAVGAISHGAIVRHCEALFGRFNDCEAAPPEPAHFVGGARFLDRPFEQHHLVLAFEGPSYFDPGYYPALVLSGVLGGGTSSRLFQKIREDHGLAYAIESFGWGFADCGILGIHAATSSDLAGKLMLKVAEECADLAGHGPSSAELARTRAQIRAGLLMSLESTGARAEQLARQVQVHGKPIPAAELEARISSVTESAVRDSAARIFRAKSRVWSEVGPGASARHVDKTVKRLMAD
jgi:predicted Zn-dependent peptidase